MASPFSFTAPAPAPGASTTGIFGGGATAGTGTTSAFNFANTTAAKPATASPFGAAAPATPNAFGTATTGGGGLFGASTATAGDNTPFTGDTNFSALPHHMQVLVWETHKLVMEHRQHAETINQFSTQDYELDQHTKKLKLDILRVQNSHSEISLASGQLRKQVERLRSYIHKLQAAESGVVQYAVPRGSLELWQQQQDSHAEILKEMVGQFEGRLLEYDSHIQELYRKVVPSRAPGTLAAAGHARREAANGSSRQITPDELATLIRLQNDALLKVAAQVAGVHDMVERLRSEWNSRTGQDPFEELDRLAAEEEERKRKAARLVVPSSSHELAQQNIFQLGNAPAASSSSPFSSAAPQGLLTASAQAPATAGFGAAAPAPAPFGAPAAGPSPFSFIQPQNALKKRASGNS